MATRAASAAVSMERVHAHPTAEDGRLAALTERPVDVRALAKALMGDAAGHRETRGA